MIDIEAARTYHKERRALELAARETARVRWLARTHEAVVRLASSYPNIRRVYLFGSITQPGRFHPGSDIDVAIICDPETEPAFWRALERTLQRDVDLRPLTSSLARSVELTGELVYER